MLLLEYLGLLFLARNIQQSLQQPCNSSEYTNMAFECLQSLQNNSLLLQAKHSFIAFEVNFQCFFKQL